MDSIDFFSKLDRILQIRAVRSVDNALNGLQISGVHAQTNKVITAVDASMDTIERAVGMGADCLFVHHGIFWGEQRAIVGSHRARIHTLLTHGCALYAAHLPLDMHASLGNNIAIAEHLGLEQIVPFGRYKGIDIGYCGALPTPQSIEQIKQQILQEDSARALSVLPFGAKKCTHVGIVSGGGTFALAEAVERNMDVLIVGDANHTLYAEAQENNINVLCAGHYNTEVWGVRRIAAHITNHLGITAEFLDLPTGL